MTKQTRRKTFSDQAVSYACIGASGANDVLIFPPQGFMAKEMSCRIGSGQERFESATSTLMTWGTQKASHLEILKINESDSEGYSGIIFNEFGAPVTPSATTRDLLFAPDGTAFLSAGTTIELNGVWAPLSRPSRYRVIYTIREERRCGYALGTIDSEPVIGEELFSVEWREDDSVWSVVRSVTKITEDKKHALLTPLIRLRQWWLRRHFVRALLPARSA